MTTAEFLEYCGKLDHDILNARAGLDEDGDPIVIVELTESSELGTNEE